MLRRRFPPLAGKRVSWSIGQAADPICLSRIMSSFSRVADSPPPPHVPLHYRKALYFGTFTGCKGLLPNY